MHQQTDFGALPRHKAFQLQATDRHRPGFTLDFKPSTRQLVERFTISLECRMHRRHLQNIAAKLRQHGFDRLSRHCRGIRLGNDLAFGITGTAALTNNHRGAIHLVGVQQVLGEFGGFAKADRQHTTGQRIERTGVPRLGRFIDRPRHNHGRVRTALQGLIKNQNAANRATFATTPQAQASPSLSAWRLRSESTAF